MHRNANRIHRRPRGFTLVEILIVVVILGILAAMVIPQFASASDASRQSTFVSNLNAFTRAAVLMRHETGAYPEDAASGTMPAGFDDYIQESRWLGGTPIGGVWDAENATYGVRSAIGVHFNGTGETRDDAFMLEIDAMLDNADLATGGFREIEPGQRYYSIVDSSAP